MDRTTQTTVTFAHPFTLSSCEGMQPAGTYQLEIDEQQIEGVTWSGYQRTSTRIHFPAAPAPGQTRYVVDVDPEELAAALAADAEA